VALTLDGLAQKRTAELQIALCPRPNGFFEVVGEASSS
jgi:hypothetical protein